MTAQRNQFFHDFPGVFAAKIALAGWAVFWPWIALHGAARVAAGIPWTGAALLVAGPIAAGRMKRHKQPRPRRPAPRTRPAGLQEKIAERDRYIAALEREAGIRP